MKKKKVKNTQENWSHKNDYPLEEIWNTDNTLAQLIAPRLRAFKSLDKHGHPGDFMDMREWNSAIQKMAYAFELMKYAGATHTEDEEQTIEQGLELFSKYFCYLWD
jgi:hypothetical protein